MKKIFIFATCKDIVQNKSKTNAMNIIISRRDSIDDSIEERYL
jgi:hypothetical protein